LEILQLWVNLPSRLKMTPPRYTGVQGSGIPAISIGNGNGNGEGNGKATLHLVSGEFGGVLGPITSLTGVFMSTVRLAAGAKTLLPAPHCRKVFLYVVRGNVSVTGTPVMPWQLVSMNDDGEVVEIAATSDAVLLYGHAAPIGEPVVARGPFVMNTAEEIARAVTDYHAGKFNGDGALSTNL
jgi:redox-sensitive bicupin YhaK (pirin superfamily)